MGEISVRPKNWKSLNANAKLLWKIQYWFYDDNLGKRKLVPIKGMNRLITLTEKQEFVKEMIAYEKDLLLQQGWNYITKSFYVPSEISGATPVIDALQFAFGKLKVECIADVRHCLECVKTVINTLGFARHTIREINAVHIEMILEKCGEDKEKWSESSYNHYRSYLLMLFKKLKKFRAVTSNPVKDVEKQVETKRIRKVLTKEERRVVKEYLQANEPDFWTFTHIFFHSGSRETEMMNLKTEDVDLSRHRFKILIKKGKSPREEWRPIKDIVLNEWRMLMKKAASGEFIFSKGLKPGVVKINASQISRRWRRIKKLLGITADFYAFKHSNLDEMSEALQKHKEAVKQASEFAGHTTPVITLKHYLTGEEQRQQDTVKKVWNEF